MKRFHAAGALTHPPSLMTCSQRHLIDWWRRSSQKRDANFYPVAATRFGRSHKRIPAQFRVTRLIESLQRTTWPLAARMNTFTSRAFTLTTGALIECESTASVPTESRWMDAQQFCEELEFNCCVNTVTCLFHSRLALSRESSSNVFTFHHFFRFQLFRVASPVNFDREATAQDRLDFPRLSCTSALVRLKTGARKQKHSRWQLRAFLTAEAEASRVYPFSSFFSR